MAKNKQIAALNEIGQSVWIDNLSRELLSSGELNQLTDQGVSGLTSNPTIFKQAIADTNSYDAEIVDLAKKGMDTEAICEELMVREVGQAADMMKGVYDRTGGGDGHVSIEVSPYLANDTAGTTAAAERLWGRLNRPNIMIKIPATPAGIPAIYSALSKGINVNVTLIFSKEVYGQVANAHIKAISERVAANKDVKTLASVASFFVSRVDAIHEKSFDELVKQGKANAADKDSFLGKIGIANSKIAYEEFGRLYGSDSFKALAQKGARVQRPLWASTGTKNPKFSATLYVEELAGKDTVNTMPPPTLKALLSGGYIGPKLHSGMSDAHALIAKVKQLGMPFEKLLVELQDVGVKLFSDSYKDLLDSITKKRQALKA
jgi:transaldolase